MSMTPVRRSASRHAAFTRSPVASGSASGFAVTKRARFNMRTHMDPRRLATPARDVRAVSRRKALCAALAALMSVAPLAAVAQDAGQAAPPKQVAAPAEPPKVLLLPTMPVDGQEINALVYDRVHKATRERMGREPKINLMPTFEQIRAELAGKGASSAIVVEAENLYNSGIGLLTAGENQKAVETFKRAVDLMEANIADVARFGVLTDALSNLALAYHNIGYTDDATKRMKEFAHLDQQTALRKEKFPKALLEIVEKEREKIKKAGPGKLSITSDLPGAEIIIDGKTRGQTPKLVEDVGFGTHHIVVRAANGKTWKQKIRVRGRGKAQRFEAKLGADAQREKKDRLPTYYTDLLMALSTGSFGKPQEPYFKELGRQTGAPFAAWVLLYRKSGSYMAAPFVYRIADGAIVELEHRRFNPELSNTRVEVTRLVREVSDALVNVPDDRRVTEVALLSKIAPPVTAVAVKTDPPKVDPPKIDPPKVDPPKVDPPKTDPVIVKTDLPKTDPTKTDRPKDPATIVRKRDPNARALASGRLVPPPIVEPSPVWKYAGIGAAGVVVTGLLVWGGMALFSGGGGNGSPSGYDAEVSW